jgi:hypothetical protein
MRRDGTSRGGLGPPGLSGGERLAAAEGPEMSAKRGLIGGYRRGGRRGRGNRGLRRAALGAAPRRPSRGRSRISRSSRVLSIHRHAHQDREAKTARGGIDDCSVPADRTRMFQPRSPRWQEATLSLTDISQRGHGEPPLRVRRVSSSPIQVGAPRSRTQVAMGWKKFAGSYFALTPSKRS